PGLAIIFSLCFFFFSSRRRHTRFSRDWSSDVCSSDLLEVDANREQQTTRDFRSGAYNAGASAMGQYRASNQRIDTYTKAGGDITDAVAGMVTGLLAERDRKNERSEERRVGKARSTRGS